MDDILVNRVTNSKLKTINLEELYPQEEIVNFDIKDYLFQELILKEKDFRQALKEHVWEQYRDKILCIHCSTDAIIPVWAYMLVSSYAGQIAHTIYTGTQDQYLVNYYDQKLDDIDLSEHKDGLVVIKGCSNKPVPASAYAKITALLKPYVKSLMYGEPCSTVPIYKRIR